MSMPRAHSAPESRPRNPFWDSRAAAAAALAQTVLNALPEALACWIGKTLGRWVCRLDGKHRRRVLRNMDVAFREELPRAEKERLCQAYFEHLGLAIVEIARFERLDRAALDARFDLSELSQLDALLARGKGVICVPAHHGNWELCAYAAGLAGRPLKLVVRPLANPALDAFLTAQRERSGNEVIRKWKVLWKLKKLLDSGAAVVLTNDQNGGTQGIFVPFFKTLASTLTSPAELHLATGAPLAVVTLNRQKNERHHRLHVWAVIEHARTRDHNADVVTVTRRINDAFETAIRTYPEQWLWVHPRWKTRPPGEPAGPDGLPPRVAE